MRLTSPRRLVILESPYAGDTEANRYYALACIADSLQRGEAPLASHLLYTQLLDDTIPEQRVQGMSAGFAWYRVAEAAIVYTDRGVTHGMLAGIDVAEEQGKLVEYRRLGGQS